MKLVNVKCPNCGATVEVHHNEDSARCDYCGTTSVVQRRSGFFQRPVQLPPHVLERSMPVAVERRSRVGTALIAAIPILGILAGIGFPLGLWLHQRYHTTWFNHGTPLIVDANGDHEQDVIGFFRPLGRDRVILAAVDGKSGERLWETGSVGSLADVATSTLVATGGVVMVATREGELRAFDLATGKQRWDPVALGEGLSAVCPSSGGVVGLVRNDGAARTLDLETGALSEAESNVSCRRVRMAGTVGGPALEIDDDLSLSAGGMRVERMLRRPGQAWVALGTKAKGTPAPMVAVFEAGAALETKHRRDAAPSPRWSALVAGKDSMRADTGEPDYAAVGDDFVATAYRIAKGDHDVVVGFDLATGKRLWKVPLPDEDMSEPHLACGSGRVFVAQTGPRGGSLRALDAHTGKVLYTLD